MSHPWRTIYSDAGISAAHRFLALSLIILAVWSLFSLWQGGVSVGRIIVACICIALVAFGFLRYSNERLETHPWGIVFASLWKTRRVNWEDISEVFVVAETNPGDKEPLTLFIIDRSGAGIDDDLLVCLSQANTEVPVIGVYTDNGGTTLFSPASGPKAARLLLGGFLESLAIRS